jgi:hypothetical protein
MDSEAWKDVNMLIWQQPHSQSKRDIRTFSEFKSHLLIFYKVVSGWATNVSPKESGADTKACTIPLMTCCFTLKLPLLNPNDLHHLSPPVSGAAQALLRI